MTSVYKTIERVLNQSLNLVVPWNEVKNAQKKEYTLTFPTKSKFHWHLLNTVQHTLPNLHSKLVSEEKSWRTMTLKSIP